MSFTLFSFVLAKNTGENITELRSAQTRKLTKQLNVPMQVSVDLNMEDASYNFASLEQQPRLKVFRPSTNTELANDPTTLRQIIFYGVLPSLGITESAKNHVSTQVFQTSNWVFNRRSVQAAKSYTATDQGAILWDQINLQQMRTNGDLGLVLGNVTTGVKRDVVYAPGKNLATLISDMTTLDQGCDIDIIPIDYWELNRTSKMGSWNAYKRKGVDRPTVRFCYALPGVKFAGGLHSNVDDIQRTRAEATTSTTATGSDGITQETYANTSSPFGLLEDWNTYSDITDAQGLLDRAVGNVANKQNAPMVLQLLNPTPEAPQPFKDYDTGDTVYVTCRSGGMVFYDLPCRVQTIDLTVDQNTGQTQTTITVATLPESIPQVVLPVDTGGGGSSGGSGGGSTPGSQDFTYPTFSNGDGIGPNENDSSDNLHGSATFACSWYQQGGTGNFSIVGWINNMVIGNSYSFSCWVKKTSAGSSMDQLGLNMKHASTGQFSDNGNDIAAAVTSDHSGGWHQTTVTFTAVATSQPYFLFEQNHSDSNPLIASDFQLVSH